MDHRFCLRLWRKWIGFLVVVLYIVVLLIALPLCIWELEKKGAADHVEAWFVGGLFVLMALPISFWGILQHVLNYTQPYLQRHIIRILWMVPIYAVNAWFALRFPAAAIYLDTLRECYEAYVIYNFMAYLLSYLHSEYPDIQRQVEQKPPVKLIFPLCWLPACQNGVPFIQRCKHGVLQYTVVRPAMTVVALLCEMFGAYGEGDFSFTSAWSYIVLINNASQILAMYCLVLFYQAFKEELHLIRPLPKFMCVKAVVFLSFWQSLAIAILVKLNVIPEDGTWVFYKNVHEVATGIQDFLICIEMFLAALAHFYSFSHKPFINMAAEQHDCCTSCLSMWDVADVTQDVVEHARYIGRGVNKRLNKDWQSESSERTPLLIDSSTRTRVQENLQNRMSPSPAIVLENESASSFEFDYKSTTDQKMESFVHKSTSLSMNNYAEFSDDAMSISSGRSSSYAPINSNARMLGSIEEKSPNLQTRSSSLRQQPPSNLNDEEFEELGADEISDEDQEDEDISSATLVNPNDPKISSINNDSEDILLPNNDLENILLPKNDSNDMLLPNNDSNDMLLPNNDSEDILLPNNNLGDILLPNNDSENILLPNNDSEDIFLPDDDSEDIFLPKNDGNVSSVSASEESLYKSSRQELEELAKDDAIDKDSSVSLYESVTNSTTQEVTKQSDTFNTTVSDDNDNPVV